MTGRKVHAATRPKESDASRPKEGEWERLDGKIAPYRDTQNGESVPGGDEASERENKRPARRSGSASGQRDGRSEPAAELLGMAMAFFRLPRKLTVSEWADERRILSSQSAEPGRWHTDHAPYQRAIMDAFTDPRVGKIVVQSSSQVGKSEILLNVIGYIIDEDPGMVLHVQPSVELGEDFSKERIAPMIADCPTLRAKVSEEKSRDSSNTIAKKKFPGGYLAIVGANAPRTLAGRPCRVVLGDEIDGWPKSAGKEGSPLKLVERRTQNFWNRKILYMSTPTIRGDSAIETEYLAGNRQEWRVQCPKCGSYEYIRLEDIRYDLEKKENAGVTSSRVSNIRWKCPACASEHGEYEMKRASAKWIAQNPEETRTASFKLNAFASPWLSWEAIIGEYVAAGDDPFKLKVFYNTLLGETYEERRYSGDVDAMLLRRENYGAELPRGVLMLTMGVDTQDDRLEYEVKGFGRDGARWHIERGVLLGDPREPGVWAALDEMLDREFAFADGNRLRIACTFQDFGGHRSSDVMRETRKRTSRGVKAIKGESRGDGKPLYRPSRKYGHDLIMLNVDVLKGIVHGSMTATFEDGGYKAHFPLDPRRGYDEDWFKGIYSEQLTVVYSSGESRLQWQKVTPDRNEPLDCDVYAEAAFLVFKWDLDAAERYLRGGQTEERRKRPAAPAGGRRIISRGVSL